MSNEVAASSRVPHRQHRRRERPNQSPRRGRAVSPVAGASASLERAHKTPRVVIVSGVSNGPPRRPLGWWWKLRACPRVELSAPYRPSPSTDHDRHEFARLHDENAGCDGLEQSSLSPPLALLLTAADAAAVWKLPSHFMHSVERVRPSALDQ
jgi:hypothetical protein